MPTLFDDLPDAAPRGGFFDDLPDAKPTIGRNLFDDLPDQERIAIANRLNPMPGHIEIDPEANRAAQVLTPQPVYPPETPGIVLSAEQLTPERRAELESKMFAQESPSFWSQAFSPRTTLQNLSKLADPLAILKGIESSVEMVASKIKGEPQFIQPEYKPSELLERPIVTLPHLKPGGTTKTDAILRGMANAGIDFAQFFATPEGVGTLGLASAPAAIQRTAAIAFGTQMAANSPELYEKAMDAAKRGDWQEAAQYTTAFAAGTLLGGKLLKEGIAPTQPLLRVNDATQIEKAAAEVGPVTAATVSTEVVERQPSEVGPVEAPKAEAPAEASAAPAALPPGAGPANPLEFEPVKPFNTQIKNETVDEQRVKRGLEPLMAPLRRTFGQVWDQAMNLIYENPSLPTDIIKELNFKPRALTDVEDAILLREQVDLHNALHKTEAEIVERERMGDTESVESLRIQSAQLSDKLIDLEEAVRAGGSETGRGLNARKMMAKEDFSLATMLTQKRAAGAGLELTEEQKAARDTEVRQLNETITELQRQLDEAEAKQKTKTIQEGIDEKVKRVRKEKPDSERDLPAEQTSIIEGIKEAVAEETPLTEFGRYIDKLSENFIRHGITDRDALVDAVHNVLKEIIPEITRDQTSEAVSGYGSFRPLNQDPIKVKLRDIKGQLQQVSKLQALLAREALKKTGPERKVPSDEERRLQKLVEEYKKRYGVTVTDPAKQLKSALDAIKTRLRNQIKDLNYQISTGKKIVRNKTEPPSDAEANALRQERDALKEQFKKIFGETEMSDEKRVQIAMNAVEKSITDLETRIANNDIGPRTRASKTPVTPELEAARARRDALKEQLQELRELANPKKTPQEIALQALKTRLKNSAAEYQRRIAEGDFAPAKRTPIVHDTEANTLRAENERWKQKFRQSLVEDRLAKRTIPERIQDTFSKWRRGFLLSGVTTLGKLTSAAVQRMTITPIEELVGEGIQRAIPGLRNAPREGGGFNTKAEAKAITEAVTTGMKDAWQTLRTGKSNLDLLYGKPDLMPRSAIDFFGQLHGALKASTKRNEFARSLEKRVANAIKEGLDPTDPLVLTKLSLEAYKDAQRSIFLQDNVVVSMYQMALQRLEQPLKETGKTPAGRKVAATVLRTMLPIVRVPTNIVAETMTYATGLGTGSIKLARGLRKGLDTLTVEERETINRHLKKGSIGAAFLLLGFFNPDIFGGYYQPGEKRKSGDVKAGAAKIGGVNIPSFVLHNPLLETLQIGATIRRVADSKLHKKDMETQGITSGIVAGILGLMDEVPFVREMLNLQEVHDPRQQGTYFGQLIRSIVIPQAVQFAAQQLDKNVEGDTIKRKPRTITEHIKTGIPGLREEVPASKNQ